MHTRSKGAQPQGDGRPITKGVNRVDTTKGALKEATPKVAPDTLPKPIVTRTRAHTDRPNPPTSAPVASRTRSRTMFQLAAAAICLSNEHAEFPGLDRDTGKYLSCGQLRRHPKYADIWNKSFSDEMERLCSGVGTRPDGKGKRVKGKNTFFVILFEYIPKGRVKEVCYKFVLCQHRPGKSNPDPTRITICGTNVRWEGDVRTNTASLKK